jgi:hypothetical protein
LVSPPVLQRCRGTPLQPVSHMRRLKPPSQFRSKLRRPINAANHLASALSGLAGGARGPPTNDQAKKAGNNPAGHLVLQYRARVAPCWLCQGRFAPAPPMPPHRGGILDSCCARRSAGRQVGTKEWRLSIEQRDGRRMLTHQRRREPRSCLTARGLDRRLPIGSSRHAGPLLRSAKI